MSYQNDEFKEPVGYYQLTCTDNDQSITIPWAHRLVDIYVRDKDARIAFNTSSGSSTTFLKEGQRYKFKLPWDQANLGSTKIHARNNASGQESNLMVIAYKEDS